MLSTVIAPGARFQFQIRRVSDGKSRQFQVRVGLAFDDDSDFIPVHQSAFAALVPLEVAHTDESDAHFELSLLLERMKNRSRAAGDTRAASDS